jgi:hypothetical protein
MFNTYFTTSVFIVFSQLCYAQSAKTVEFVSDIQRDTIVCDSLNVYSSVEDEATLLVGSSKIFSVINECNKSIEKTSFQFTFIVKLDGTAILYKVDNKPLSTLGALDAELICLYQKFVGLKLFKPATIGDLEVISYYHFFGNIHLGY